MGWTLGLSLLSADMSVQHKLKMWTDSHFTVTACTLSTLTQLLEVLPFSC